MFGAQMPRVDEERSETPAPREPGDRGLELIERDRPLAEEEVSQAIVGIPRAGEDDSSFVDVDLLRDLARGHVQHTGRVAAAEIPQQIGDAESLESAVDEARRQCRLFALVHALSLSDAPDHWLPTRAWDSGTDRGCPTPLSNLGPLRNRSKGTNRLRHPIDLGSLDS
jgi:hypothetical protein